MPDLGIRSLLEALQRHQVRYVLFGSLGAIAYGAQLTTRDMDICPALEPANLRRLADLLLALGAKPRHVPGYTVEAECAAWTPEPVTAATLDHEFVTPFGPLDIVPAPYGPNGTADRFTYERLDRDAVTMIAFGIPLRVGHIDDIVASKMSARRAKDARVLAELLRVKRCLVAGEPLLGLAEYVERGGA